MFRKGGVPSQNSRDEPSGLEIDFESISRDEAATSMSSLDEVAERVLSEGTLTPQEKQKDEISDENLNDRCRIERTRIF